LDGVERAQSFSGCDGLAFEGFEIGKDLLLRARFAATDAKLAQDTGLRPATLVARGQVGGPVLRTESVGEQGGAVGLRGQIALVDQLAALG